MAENMAYNVGGSSCYDNKDENCAKYGRLYTFEAAQKTTNGNDSAPLLKIATARKRLG